MIALKLNKRLLQSIFLIMFIVANLNMQAQMKPAVAELLLYADQKYGTNDFLVNGWKYFPDHFNAKGNPYFNQLNWTDGEITTAGSETFDKLELQYNIQMDEVVLKQTLNDGSTAFVMLNKDFIDAFTIGEHQFVKVQKVIPESDLQGFVEIIYAGEIQFFTKHQKSFVRNFSADTPYGSISKQNSTNYLLLEGVLIKVQTKKALLNIFPEHKKEIRKFMKVNKIRYKKAAAPQLRDLIQLCDEL